MTTAFAGLGPILRLGLRRDRLRLATWVAGLAVFPVASYTSYESLLPTAASRRALMANFGSTPAFRLLLGQARDLGHPGGFTAWRSGLFSGIFVALMAVFTVVRHTRAEEDSGRAEIVGSGVVGRRTALASGLILAVGTAALAAVGAAGLLMGAGASPSGSIATGAALLATGAAFAGVAAVAAQVGSFAHTANGMATAVLGVSYVVRAWGDSSEGATAVSWMSPLGWGQQVHAFTGNRWWVLSIPIGASVVLVSLASWLLGQRDVGSGLMASRRGRAMAGPALTGLFGLAWRLHRGVLVGWIVGYAVSGALFGSITTSAGRLLGDNPTMARILAAGVGSPTAAFVASMVSILGITAAAYGVQAVSRARREETDGRVEPLLATATTRRRWLASHLVFALVGSGVVVVVGGFAVGLGAVGATGAPSVASTVGASLAQVPAVWVVVGLAAALLGAAPRFVALGWSAVTAAFVLTFFGPLLDLPRRVLELSPFTHLSRAPAEAVSAVPVMVLCLVAVALVGVAATGMSRRDI